MFEAVYAQGALFKRVFDAIKEMCSQVNIQVTENGIQMQAMDSSHVSLVELELKMGAFQTYRCDNERMLGLNMSHVVKVFKVCNADDSVTIRHDDGNPDKLKFVFMSPSEDRLSEFEIQLLQIDEEQLGVPDDEFDANIIMPSKLYAKTISDFSQFSDAIAITAHKQDVTFGTKGDIGSGTVILKAHNSGPEEESVRINMKTNDEVGMAFAARYLAYYAKACPLSSQVQLQMSMEQPLVLTFNLENDSEIGHLKYYLAPKIQEEESMMN